MIGWSRSYDPSPGTQTRPRLDHHSRRPLRASSRKSKVSILLHRIADIDRTHDITILCHAPLLLSGITSNGSIGTNTTATDDQSGGGRSFANIPETIALLLRSLITYSIADLWCFLSSQSRIVVGDSNRIRSWPMPTHSRCRPRRQRAALSQSVLWHWWARRMSITTDPAA